MESNVILYTLFVDAEHGLHIDTTLTTINLYELVVEICKLLDGDDINSTLHMEKFIDILHTLIEQGKIVMESGSPNKPHTIKLSETEYDRYRKCILSQECKDIPLEIRREYVIAKTKRLGKSISCGKDVGMYFDLIKRLNNDGKIVSYVQSFVQGLNVYTGSYSYKYRDLSG